MRKFLKYLLMSFSLFFFALVFSCRSISVCKAKWGACKKDPIVLRELNIFQKKLKLYCIVFDYPVYIKGKGIIKVKNLGRGVWIFGESSSLCKEETCKVKVFEREVYLKPVVDGEEYCLSTE